MKKLGLVKASTLEPFIRFLTENDINLTPHFQKANLAPSLIQTGDTWIPKQQLYKFLADVASAQKIASLGLLVGDQICVADLGEVGSAIHRCPTLEKACQCFAESVPRIAEGNTCSLVADKKEVWFSFRTLDHQKGNRDEADHYGMMMLLSIIRLIEPTWYPEKVTIQTGDCNAFSSHPSWKNTRVEFNAEATGFCFPSEWLQRPIPPAPSAAKTSATPQPSGSPPPTSLTQTLEYMLSAFLNIGGAPSLEKVSASLNMSPRSFQRRLAEEGESYSQLIERIRIDAAQKLLLESGKSVKEIAYILGYSGSNNFIRAFQRLQGCSPKVWKTKKRNTVSDIPL